jgi:hypothetical protein
MALDRRISALMAKERLKPQARNQWTQSHHAAPTKKKRPFSGLTHEKERFDDLRS